MFRKTHAEKYTGNKTKIKLKLKKRELMSVESHATEAHFSNAAKFSVSWHHNIRIITANGVK